MRSTAGSVVPNPSSRSSLSARSSNVLTLHLIGIIVTGCAVAYSDEQALLWMLGKKPALSKQRVDALHIVVSIGLACIIATGGLLFLRSPSYYLSDPVFLLKMLLVGALIVNGFFIDQLSVGATERPFQAHSARERLPLFISGFVSAVGWLGAALCGLLLG